MMIMMMMTAAIVRKAVNIGDDQTDDPENHSD